MRVTLPHILGSVTRTRRTSRLSPKYNRLRDGIGMELIKRDYGTIEYFFLSRFTSIIEMHSTI